MDKSAKIYVAEHHQTVVLVQLFQQFGQVGGLLFFGDLAQLDVLLFDQPWASYR